jgi:hypothetical protein
MFNDSRYAVCPYCKAEPVKPPALGRDETAELPIGHEVAKPACGWLVCVKGPSRGHDYKIKSGKNFIGRADDMDIQVLGDNEIALRRHAAIAYDPKKGNTVLLPGDSNELVYCQDNPIYAPVELEAYNKIELGNSRFLFVPFCGDHFVWEDTSERT